MAMFQIGDAKKSGSLYCDTHRDSSIWTKSWIQGACRFILQAVSPVGLLLPSPAEPRPSLSPILPHPLSKILVLVHTLLPLFRLPSLLSLLSIPSFVTAELFLARWALALVLARGFVGQYWKGLISVRKASGIECSGPSLISGLSNSPSDLASNQRSLNCRVRRSHYEEVRNLSVTKNRQKDRLLLA